MIKTVCSLLIVLALFTNSQAQERKFYINPYGMVRHGINFKTPVVGGGLSGGARIGNLGIGAGAELFKIYSNFKTSVPVFIDCRYFLCPAKKYGDHPKTQPFAAVNFGKMFWNNQLSTGSISDNYITTFKGKLFVAADLGFIFAVTKTSGIAVSFGYKNYAIQRTGTHRYSISPAGTPIPVTETKSDPCTDHYSELVLKVGLQF